MELTIATSAAINVRRQPQEVVMFPSLFEEQTDIGRKTFYVTGVFANSPNFWKVGQYMLIKYSIERERRRSTA